jgi:hypothetical protein
MKKHRALHKVGDCEMSVGAYVLCATRATFIMTRVDATTMSLCTRHANVVQAQIDSRPDSFNPVRFTQINPKNQLSKGDE